MYILVHLFCFVKIIVHSLILVLLFSSDDSILAETMIYTWSFHLILISHVLFTYSCIVLLLLYML